MISFFARNGVAANLLMAAILIAGFVTLYTKRIPLEVFPEFDSRMISVSVPYRGATPEEVEESIVIRIEEAISDVEGIEQIVSSAGESGGTVTIEVDQDYDRRDVLDEVKARVDGIPDFPPGDAENATVRLADSNRWVIGVVLYGDMSEYDLRKMGEQVRDEITNLPDVSGAELQGVRPYEITIEIDETALLQYGLSFDRITQALRSSSIDLPAGTMKTASGEIALRTKGRAYTKEEFEDISILTTEDGQRLTVKDIATVTDGFDENLFLSRYISRTDLQEYEGDPLNEVNRRCVLIAVFREGNQSAIQIADQIKAYMDDASKRYANFNVGFSYWSDSSRIVQSRLETLTDSAWKSALFVFLLLTLFLRPALAFWVVIGIPVCFLGTFALMPFLGVSINVVSLFAFILVLGVVVDDAIVTGENIYTWQRRGVDPTTASIEGTREVSLPVIFGILTTMLAFMPMIFGDDDHSSWQKQIAIIVVVVLAFSLVESKLILPAHLAHVRFAKERKNWFARVQNAFASSLEKFARHVYQPVLEVALRWRYATLAVFLGGLMLVVGSIFGGKISMVPFPRVESDRVTCRLSMQEGTPFEVTDAHIDRIIEKALELKEDYKTSTGESVILEVLSSVGGQGVSSSRSRDKTGSTHLGEVVFYLMARDERMEKGIEFNNMELVNDWRERIGQVVGAKELTFRAEIFRTRDPIDIQLAGNNPEELIEAAAKVRQRMETYAGLFDINDSLDDARDEIQLRIKPEAEQFGLTMADLARKVRQAFFGEEIQRLIRGRDEVRVMLRFPESDRRSLAALEATRIRTPDGQEVPFTSVAEATYGKSFPRIQRIDRNRSVNIRADADKENADLDSIRADLSLFLETLVAGYPGMRFSFEGEGREQQEANRSLIISYLLVLFGIYVLLAIPFRSYVQPFMVMLVIPFGLIGAVIGHLIEGHPLSMLSQFGMLALAGVVVNDSLVLVDFINRRVREGHRIVDAVRTAGVARFRPILLTSITTFAGLYPLLQLESTQAQVLIPMAISLGYGILFATLITLMLVPVSYLILEDIKALYSRPPEKAKKTSPPAAPGEDEPQGLPSPS